MQLNQGDIGPGILVMKAWVPGDSGAWGFLGLTFHSSNLALCLPGLALCNFFFPLDISLFSFCLPGSPFCFPNSPLRLLPPPIFCSYHCASGLDLPHLCSHPLSSPQLCAVSYVCQDPLSSGGPTSGGTLLGLYRSIIVQVNTCRG